MTDRPFDFLYENPDKPTEPTHLIVWGNRYSLRNTEVTEQLIEWDFNAAYRRIAVTFDGIWQPLQEKPKRPRRRQTDLGLRRPK